MVRADLPGELHTVHENERLLGQRGANASLPLEVVAISTKRDSVLSRINSIRAAPASGEAATTCGEWVPVTSPADFVTWKQAWAAADPDAPSTAHYPESLRRHFPRSTIVGYETGTELSLALSTGFLPTGDLSVWTT